MLKRITGFVLIIVESWVMFYATPIIAPSGLTLSSLAFIWMFVLILAITVSLFLDSGLRDYYKSLIIVFALFIPWSLIFLIQLPDESQFLLALFISSVAILFYRRYYQKHKPQKTAHIESIEEKGKKTEPQQVSQPEPTHEGSGKPSLLRKIIGVLLTIVGAFSLFIVFPAMMTVNIINALFFSIPATLPLFIGYSLIVKRRLKDALLSWIAYTSFVLLIMIFVLPLIYQILSACFILIAFVSFLYWYRSRYFKSKSEAVKHDDASS
jgi:membrane protein implicated in regulation of membrane protease activity